MTRIEERAGNLASGLKEFLDQVKADGAKPTRSFSRDVSDNSVNAVGRSKELARRAGQLLSAQTSPIKAHAYKLLLTKMLVGFSDSNLDRKLSQEVITKAANLNFRGEHGNFIDVVHLGYKDGIQPLRLKIDSKGWNDSAGIHHPLSFSIFEDQTLFTGSSHELVFNSRDHFNKRKTQEAERAIAKRLQGQGFELAI